jgi:hypothetical protein
VATQKPPPLCWSGAFSWFFLKKGKRDKMVDVVHLKGFGLRIDYSDLKTSSLARATVDFIVAMSPSVLVWDGDSYARSSSHF